MSVQREPVKGVLTDLDGTIVDTKLANFHAYRVALAELGVDFTWELFLTTWGQDSRNFIPRLAPHLSPEQVRGVRQTKARRYSEFFTDTRLNEPLVQVFRNLNGSCKLALVTTAKRRNALEILDHHGLAGLFGVIVCGDDVKVPKPGAEPYLKALALLNLPAHLCVAFEDSEAGIESARLAGLGVVVVRF